MVGRFNLHIRFFDLAIGANQIADAFGFARLCVWRGTIRHGYLKRLVTQKVKPESLFVVKSLVLGRCIVADSEHYGVLVFELLDSITESLTFLGSAAG